MIDSWAVWRTSRPRGRREPFPPVPRVREETLQLDEGSAASSPFLDKRSSAMSRPYLRHQAGRMFENNFLEACSKVHPSIPFLFYIPLTVAFFGWALYGGKTTVGMSALFLPLGVLTWIGMEYSLHRYFFHWEGNGP